MKGNTLLYASNDCKPLFESVGNICSGSMPLALTTASGMVTSIYALIQTFLDDLFIFTQNPNAGSHKGDYD